MINEGEPAMVAASAKHDIACEAGVMREHAHDQRTFAAIGERNRVSTVLIGY